jgi:hypothetical protein
MVLAAHAVSTVFMAGVCWFVQIVHYPLMSWVSPQAFHGFSREHQTRTSIVVGPMMFIELGTAVGLALTIPEDRMLAFVGLALLLVIWISTFTVQGPTHRVLERRFESRPHRHLVLSNWIRTLAWTARVVIAMMLMMD